jgi:hypothetical protein
MSARYDCQSRDMDKVSPDFLPHFRSQGFGSAKVDRPTKRVFEVELEAHEPVEGRFSLKCDEDVEIAPLVLIAPRHRVKYGEALYAEPKAQLPYLGFQTIKDDLTIRSE